MANGDLHTHDLAGCTPVPLAGYLKALGILRLVAEDTERGDPDACSWWQDETFRLRTRLDCDALLGFFLNDYRPSPIMAPWNGGSGFFDCDNRDGFTPLAESPAGRFAAMRAVIHACHAVIADSGLKERPQDDAKTALVIRLRAELPDGALAWIDAALALSRDELLFPPLLGTGGNDGRLDFTNNFMRRLVSDRRPRGLFDAATGAPGPDAIRLLPSALFGDATDGLTGAAIGQFAPGSAGGPNTSPGFEGAPNLNPWDFVLTIEGALLFAGALTRRNESARQGGASFPFTVRATGAGWGGVSMEDEANARAEFWAPLWRRPTGAREIMRLLTEGRAVLNGKTVRDGLEFARAAGGLGVSRGVDAFQRFGFVMRAGKAYLAAPLGRRPVTGAPERAVTLIADLERGHWLDRVRLRLRGGDEAARARNAVRRLDDALFALTGSDAGTTEVQAALIALGAVARYLATAPKARENLPPPPTLSQHWLEHADDRTPEFRVAAALASLGHPHGGAEVGAVLPMMAHFAPLDLSQPIRGNPAWFDDKRRTNGTRDGRLEAIWGAGGLVRNLTAVLERRLIGRTGREEGVADTLCAAAPARLTDVLAFLAGPQAFDDARCADLLAGLVWVRPAFLPREAMAGRREMPLAYAALKPLFTPADRLRRDLRVGKQTVRLLAEDTAIPVPPGLPARLLRGEIAESVKAAFARAHASGIESPFCDRRSPVDPGRPVDAARRLAAALLIPLDDVGLGRTIARAYPPPATPEPENDMENDHAA
jgi:CRISPR-associated protein Csx17